jgi:hypothetical protein
VKHALLAAACLASPALAQERTDTAPLRLSANTRIRLETIEGQARAGFNSSDGLLNFRTILGARYDAATATCGWRSTACCSPRAASFAPRQTPRRAAGRATFR